MTPTPTLALHTSRRSKRLVLLAALTGLTAFLSSSVAGAQPEQGSKVRVMTQNMYIGPLGIIREAAAHPETLPGAVSKGTIRISVCERAIERYAAMALMKRSPKMTAN